MANRFSVIDSVVMRLPSYSHLLALPAGPDLLLRLCETFVVASSALAAQRIYGTAAGYDNAAVAFTIIFAWVALSGFYVKSPTRKPSLPCAVLLPALGWMLCEVCAVCLIRWMHPMYAPSGAWLACLGISTSAGVVLCRAIDRIAGARRAHRVSVAVVGRGARCATLEWLFRVIQEPRRMWKRYLVTNAQFAVMLGKAYLART